MAVRPNPSDAGGTAQRLLEAARDRERGRHVADAVAGYIEAGRAFLEGEADAERAKRAFDAAAALDPENLELEFQRGIMDAIHGRTRDALEKFLNVVRRSGQTHVKAVFEAGIMYQELGQFDSAVLAFRRVLDRDSGNVQALVNVAQRLAAMGMRPEALNHYLAAAETAFDKGQLGTCRHLLGLIQSMDPLNAKARLMLADLNSVESASETHAHPEMPSLPQAPANGDRLTAPGGDVFELEMMRAERDSLKAELRTLAAAVAAEETELATLRARREAAANVLASLQSDVGRRAKLGEAEAAPKKRARRNAKTVTVDHEDRRSTIKVDRSQKRAGKKT